MAPPLFWQDVVQVLTVWVWQLWYLSVWQLSTQSREISSVHWFCTTLVHLVMQSVDWSVVLQLAQRASQSWEQFLWQLFMLPPNRLLDTASAVQLSVHSLTQTSCELLLEMVSHSSAHEALRVWVQLVVSDTLQLELHMENVFSAQTCSTDVTAQVVMHS